MLDAAPADPASTMPIDMADSPIILPAGVTVDDPTTALPAVPEEASHVAGSEPGLPHSGLFRHVESLAHRLCALVVAGAVTGASSARRVSRPLRG